MRVCGLRLFSWCGLGPGLGLAALPCAISIAAASAIASSEVEVRFFRASSVGPSGVEDFASQTEGKIFQARSDAEFVRLSWFFEKPIQMTRVIVESCSGPFEDGADFILNGTEQIVFVEGGKPSLAADIKPLAGQNGGIRSATVNFKHSKAVCVKVIRFFDGQKQLKIVYPKSVIATVPGVHGGASDGSWRTSHPMNLFDSRPETSWRPNLGLERFTIEFDREKRIESIRVWNGDQRSGRDFRSLARVERLMLKDASADSAGEVLTLVDAAGVQDIKLKKPITAKRLMVRIESVFEGVNNVRPALSELRFVGPDGAFAPQADFRQRELEARNRSAIEKAGFGEILDREFVTRDEDDIWHFRLRSDGTFFVRGFSDETGKPRAFQGTGTYDLESISKQKARFRIFGLKTSAAGMADADICFLACGAAPSAKEDLIDEELLVDRLPNGKFMIRNRNRVAQRTLPFSDLPVRISSLRE